mmetsp:Transcript_7462/g.8173  ORF Transcript_7462/g.8173 Transcript_7462/m.8173 type:complete len:288 (+) Transcript_7462:22-885(+)
MSNMDETEPGTSAFNPGSCRFYENEFPDKDELVMVKITEVSEIGVFGKLLEYNMLDCFIPMSEISRTRIKSVQKHLKKGQTKVLQVLRVDQARGYVDLTKKYLTKEDIEDCTNSYNRAKTVYNIVNRMASVWHKPMKDLYEKVVWPLDNTYEDGSFSAFRKIADDQDDILTDIDYDEQFKGELTKEIRKRLAIQPLKVVAEISITCYSERGIDDIKDALSEGFFEDKVQINHRASPLYWIHTTSTEEAEARQLIVDSIKRIEDSIAKRGGELKVTREPEVAGDTDDF